MDILTPRGQQSLVYERRAAEIIESNWDVKYFKTPSESPAAFDAVLVRDGEIVVAAETKCRALTLSQLMDDFGGEWLITFSKLEQGKEAATLMWVPFWGFLYLIPEDVVLRIKIWSPCGGWLVPFRVDKTASQASINGGEAIRDNAFVMMNDADVLRHRVPADDWWSRD